MTEADTELYHKTEPARVLSDEEWEALQDTPAEQMDERTKVAFFATSKWHFLRRVDATFAPQGWSAGDMSFDDVMREIEGQG